MALPVVLKSGKNYITLVLDDEMPFSELLSHIVNKFIENSSFFKGQSFAIMLEGRKLDDREKNIILDAIADYTNVKITMLIENDSFREYAAEKAVFDKLHPVISDDEDDEGLHTIVENNCLYIGRDIKAGERIYADNNVIVRGNVESGAIIKAGNSIIIIGKLEGQALAGNDDRATSPYIIAKEFYPENYRIGPLLGSIKSKKKGLRKVSPQIAQLIDGEIQIKPYKD